MHGATEVGAGAAPTPRGLIRFGGFPRQARTNHRYRRHGGRDHRYRHDGRAGQAGGAVPAVADRTSSATALADSTLGVEFASSSLRSLIHIARVAM